MQWHSPQLLLALWLLPVVAGLLVDAHRRRVRAAGRFADPIMAARLMPPLRRSRGVLRGLLLLAGVACLIVAAARPRFGMVEEKVTRRGADLFILLDVSRSMLAEDVRPSRLQRAKSDIRDLLRRVRGDRVGLIVFAGKPVTLVPLTSDQGFLLQMLDQAGPESAPRGGSLIGDAIRAALAAMPEERTRDQALILITDGEDHDSYPEQAAQTAAQRGMKVFTVGLGDAREGARIPVVQAGGRQGYLTYSGQEVWSRVDEKLLRSVALATGGAYVPAGTRNYDLGQVYDDHLAALTRGTLAGQRQRRYREQFQWFVGLGILLLLAERALPVYGPTKELA